MRIIAMESEDCIVMAVTGTTRLRLLWQRLTKRSIGHFYCFRFTNYDTHRIRKGKRARTANLIMAFPRSRIRIAFKEHIRFKYSIFDFCRTFGIGGFWQDRKHIIAKAMISINIYVIAIFTFTPLVVLCIIQATSFSWTNIFNRSSCSLNCGAIRIDYGIGAATIRAARKVKGEGRNTICAVHFIFTYRAANFQGVDCRLWSFTGIHNLTIFIVSIHCKEILSLVQLSINIILFDFLPKATTRLRIRDINQISRAIALHSTFLRFFRMQHICRNAPLFRLRIIRSLMTMEAEGIGTTTLNMSHAIVGCALRDKGNSKHTLRVKSAIFRNT